MKKELAAVYLTAIVCAGLFLISSTVRDKIQVRQLILQTPVKWIKPQNDLPQL